MLSPESLQIQSYLFANKTAQGLPASLPEQRAWFDMMVEKYAGYSIPLPEGTRVESVNVDGMPAKAANFPVELIVWECMWHVFQQYFYVSPEGQRSLDDIGRFIRRQTML
jgi:hypothetical protein